MIFRDEDITYNEKLHPIARKMEVACLIGRKIGRQMLSFISSLSCFWLNEGIATVLFASDIINKVNFLYILGIISLKSKIYFS